MEENQEIEERKHSNNRIKKRRRIWSIDPREGMIDNETKLLSTEESKIRISIVFYIIRIHKLYQL